jgi:prepilin-type N-terminal cleavage/methylation domain-containing protein
VTDAAADHFGMNRDRRSRPGRARRHGTNPGRRPAAGSDGFTLLEMMVALAIATVVLAALASALGAALRVAGLQKTRAQANEVATQAIEDLQELDYDHLGVCSPAPSPPAGLTSPVYLANCSSPVPADPCTATVGTVPDTVYTCTRLGIVYQVRRYVAWTDSAHTEKRLAVLVDWTDQAGNHQVQQQSSLRSPDQGSVVGLPPPSFSATSILVNGSTAGAANPIKLVGGLVQSTVRFAATPSGLPDGVFVSFVSLQGGTPVTSTLPLSPDVNPGSWAATLPAGSNQFTFGSGTQYVTFVAVRSGDGKVNSQPNAQAVTFVTCQPGGVSCTSSPNPPSLSGVTVTPTTARTDSAGLLCGDVRIAATATNLTPTDSVTVSFQTLAGPYSVALASSDGSAWSGVIPAAAGYRFAAGSQQLYVTAAQGSDPAASPPVYGSTAAVPTPAITFGGSCP